MVRLKDAKTFVQRDMREYFNSTMVRLKARPDMGDGMTSIFQFHYGTIKRLTELSKQHEELWFQFHYGTIKSKPQTIQIVFPSEFQFHYGTIKRR